MKTLTKWEAGNVLAGAADHLFDHEKDLREAGYRRDAALLRKLRLALGDHFNEHYSKEHQVGLPGTKDEKARTG